MLVIHSRMNLLHLRCFFLGSFTLLLRFRKLYSSKLGLCALFGCQLFTVLVNSAEDIRQDFCPLHESNHVYALARSRNGKKEIESCIRQYLACLGLPPSRWSPLRGNGDLVPPVPGPDRPPWPAGPEPYAVVRGWCRHAGSVTMRRCAPPLLPWMLRSWDQSDPIAPALGSSLRTARSYLWPLLSKKKKLWPDSRCTRLWALPRRGIGVTAVVPGHRAVMARRQERPALGRLREISGCRGLASCKKKQSARHVPRCSRAGFVALRRDGKDQNQSQGAHRQSDSPTPLAGRAVPPMSV